MSFKARHALLKDKITASFFWSNIGLFHLIYNTVVFNAKKSKSPKRAASVFFQILNVLFLLLKMLSLKMSLNIRNVVYMFKL